MPFTLQHASPEIEQQIMAHQHAMNNARMIPQTPDIYKQVSEANRVYIFNVGPWAHRRELGSAGSYTVKACPAGAEYSEPVVVNGVVEEPYPINEAECKVIPTEGINLANQIIGEGPFAPKSMSFVPFGVFISPSNPPSKALVAEARAQLQQKFLDLISEANAWHADGNREMIMPAWHFVAARAMKKSKAECAWLENSEVGAKRDNCPSCGTVYNVGIMKCRDCGYVLDKPRYDKALKDGLFAV